MQKVFLSLICMLCLVPAGAQNHKSDTVKIIDNVNRLLINQKHNTTTTIIISTDNNQNGYIYEVIDRDTSDLRNNDWYIDLPFVKEKNKQSAKRSVTGVKNIYGGWTFNYRGKGPIRNHFEAGILEVIGVDLKPSKTGPVFNFGVGFGFRQFNLKGDVRFDKEDNSLAIHDIEGEESIEKSSLRSWTFDVPLLITQKIKNNFAITGGALLNFNTYSTAKSEYRKGGIKYTENYKGLNQNFFTVDIIGMIGFTGGIGFYCRWSPMPLFKCENGPKFRSASIGITLNY